MFEIGKLTRLDLGRQGENRARVVAIDMNAWLEEFPGANIGMMLKRPGESTFYPAALEMEDGIIEFEVTRADVAIAGEGEAQIILTNEDDVELRSRVVKTRIGESMSGTEVEAPDPETTFVTQVINAAAQAEAAVEKMPTIGDNGNWYMWDAEAEAYVDTGLPSRGEDGVSPTVEVQEITGGHRVIITDADGSKTFDVMDGEDGVVTDGDGTVSGADGGYYIPTVVDGILSWTASKADMPAVASANVQGPKGDTPVRGTDYWTETDQQSIVNDVLAALPVYNGEVETA